MKLIAKTKKGLRIVSPMIDDKREREEIILVPIQFWESRRLYIAMQNVLSCFDIADISVKWFSSSIVGPRLLITT